MLNVTVSAENGLTLISLDGRFDGLGAQVFDRKIEELTNWQSPWALDFQEVSYLSSAGLRSLVKLGKRLRQEKGDLILVGLSPDVRWVLETTGLLGLFQQADTLEEAMAMAREKQVMESSLQGFRSLERDCTFQILSTQDNSFDLWNHAGIFSFDDLNASHLMTASMEDLGIAFGVGALGANHHNAFEGLGSFVSLGSIAGVLPADGYNQPDFMVANQPRDTMTYIAAAIGFSGNPWARIDLGEGPPVKLIDLEQLIAEKLREAGKTYDLTGVVMLLETKAGHGFYYPDFAGLLNNRTSERRWDHPQTMIAVGLYGSSGWKAGETLASYLERWGAGLGQPFFIGNGVLAGIPDWDGIRNPEDLSRRLSDFDVLQDIVGVNKDLEVTRARLWLYTPGTIRTGEEKRLAVEVLGDYPLPMEWEIITRRLYADAQRVILDPLHGGFSSAKPFKVTAYDQAGRRMLPTVLKLGPADKVRVEIEAHQKYVEKYILNNSTTIMGTSTYGGYSGIRYNFVGISGPDSSLTWLTNLYREKPVEELLPLFDNIFTRILKPWYGQPRWETIMPYKDHDPLAMFSGLLEAAEREFGISADAETIECPELEITLPNPYHFLKHEFPLRRSFTQLWYTGINHGDLNMQNLLLDERQNVYIIDFSETRPRNIVSDFARLEPIFKFEMINITTQEDLEDLLPFEQGLAAVSSLSQTPPFIYHGSDPEVEKAYHMICRVRQYAKTVVIFEDDVFPYLVAMLEWTYPVIVYGNISSFAKKLAIYSAAFIVQQILRLQP
ncbi:MAG: anti-sigma factor antagonist [Bacillota bacterium]